mgnify:CR=1 FL=1|jgi:hypothetical protein
MSNDYFFQMVDARGELAATRVTLENLVRAIEIESPIQTEVSLKLAKEQIEVITTLLEKEIH